MKSTRPTKAQVEARVTEILRIRLDGAQMWDIREYVREKEQEDGSPWKLADGAKSLSESQLWRYIAKADKVIAQNCHASRKKHIRHHVAQRQNLYAKAVSQGDVRAALACVRDEAELLGLYPGKGGNSQDDAKDASAFPPIPPADLMPFAEWEHQYLAHHFTDPDSRFHVELDAKLANLHQQRNQKVSIIAPRGSAKSTRVSLAYPLYAALHKLEPYIVLISDTDSQARQHLDNLKKELETNEALLEKYPQLTGRGKVWRSGSIRLANGVQIDALGTGGKIRGRRVGVNRPSLIIVDDPQSIDHVISPVLRQQSLRWLKADVCNAGSPQTNILVLGTALHRECIVCALQTTAGWENLLFRQLEAFPERMDLWQEWEELYTDWQRDDREQAALAFYEAHQALMDAGAVPLWPERFPLYEVMAKRLTIGPAAFNSEQQGSPVDPAACEWPAEWFDSPNVWFDQWPEDLQVRTMALDPSKGQTDKPGDPAAYVLFGRDRRGVEYYEAHLLRADTVTIMEKGIELMRWFRPEAIFIEFNQWNDLLKAEFERRARAAGDIPTTLVAQENHVPKVVRIRRLTPPFSMRQARFRRRSPGTMEMITQAKDFPNGAHDDALDAAEMARRLAIGLINGRASGRR